MTALSVAPSHWTVTTIGQIAEVRLGRQRSPKNHAGNLMRPYLRAGNVDWYRLRAADTLEMNFADEEMQSYALAEGDILVVEGSGSASEVGKCALVPKGYEGHAFQNTLIRIRPSFAVDSRWLMYRINAEAELGGFLQLARGVGIFHLGSTRLAAWPLALPPLAEQRATVETIERMLSRLAEAESLVSTAAQRLDALNRSLLERAYSGTLIPAHEGTWELLPLGSLADTALGKMLSSETRTGEYTGMYLRNESVQWGRIDTSDLKPMSIPRDQVDRYSVRDGDLLVCEGGQPGRCAVWRSSEPMLYQKALHRVRPREGVTADWLAFAIEAAVRTNRHQSLLTGTTIAHLPQEKLRKLPVPIGQSSAMAAVLAAVQQTQTRSLRLKHSQAEVHSKAVALRRSILKAAFEGRLTAGSDGARSLDAALEEIA